MKIVLLLLMTLSASAQELNKEQILLAKVHVLEHMYFNHVECCCTCLEKLLDKDDCYFYQIVAESDCCFCGIPE